MSWDFLISFQLSLAEAKRETWLNLRIEIVNKNKKRKKKKNEFKNVFKWYTIDFRIYD